MDNILTAYNPRGFAPDALKIVVDVDAHEIAKLEMDIAETVVSDAHDFILALQRKASHPTPHGQIGWLVAKTGNVVIPERWAASPDTRPHFTCPTYGCALGAIPPPYWSAREVRGWRFETFYTIFATSRASAFSPTSEALARWGMGCRLPLARVLPTASSPWCVESDGSLQLNIQELATLRAFDLPICLIVMNNGGYASHSQYQHNYFSGRYVGTGRKPGFSFLLGDARAGV